MKPLKILLICIIAFNYILAGISPKQEFRGVWLSTVANIDWPENPNDPEEKKIDDLKNHIRQIHELGANAVLFQVRPSCDAMYKSEIEPWSFWFTGQQGTGPEPNWDPLELAIAEAHKYGMELHAWVNPYRAVVNPSKADSLPYICRRHVANQHEDWLLKFNSVYILDPGKKAVRDYIESVLMDIVTRYDIDGLHMDDYFYPYEKISNQDSLTFLKQGRGFDNIHNWRRDNINLLVKAMSDGINKVKPWVKWGISPFGIYRPNVPEGIKGFDAWAVLYCDPLAWLEAGTVDYITPQCYWPHGGGQDYGKLIPYWSKKAKKYKRHFYPGQALYRAGTDKFPQGEIPRQVRLNRKTDGCDGSVYFTANDIQANHKGTTDSLAGNLYSSKSLWPVMKHKKPEAPHATDRVDLHIGQNGNLISWSKIKDAWGYVIYRSKTPVNLFSSAENIREIIVDSNTDEWFDQTDKNWFYAVSVLNDYKVESYPVQPVYDFVTPKSPTLDKEKSWKRVVFKWNKKNYAGSYHLQVAEDRQFKTIVYQERYIGRSRQVHRLPGGKRYFWRVKTDKSVLWSPVWFFSIK